MNEETCCGYSYMIRSLVIEDVNTETENRELREDGGIELREDGGIELRN